MRARRKSFTAEGTHFVEEHLLAMKALTTSVCTEPLALSGSHELFSALLTDSFFFRNFLVVRYRASALVAILPFVAQRDEKLPALTANLNSLWHSRSFLHGPRTPRRITTFRLHTVSAHRIFAAYPMPTGAVFLR